jgi:hypothetical protein
MEDRIEHLLLSRSEIDFGPINFSERESEFYRQLNNEIILLCKSLPESIQTDALLFFVQYSKMSLGQDLEFFRHYYAPAWSIIYWLIESGPNDRGLTKRDIKNAITAHSMAMSLHSLDDHLSDGEMPVTHLALLLRSQSWMIMNGALNSLSDGFGRGRKVVQAFINDYYSGICSSEEVESLNGYCDLFRKQMATGLIVPVLLTKMMCGNEEFARAIQAAYESFGIAWRLLDDIKDVEADMMKCIHSSIYVCLPEKIKKLWDNHTGEESDEKNDYRKTILDCILKNRVIETLRKRICSELESARSVADRHKLTGLAEEFRCLLKPLKNGNSPL